MGVPIEPCRPRSVLAVAGLVASAALAIAACGSAPLPQPPARAVATTAAPCPEPEGLGDSEAASQGAAAVELVCLVTVPRALAITSAGDGTGRLFVTSQNGQIWTLQGGRRSDQPLLDLTGSVSLGQERGLLGLAVHPGFPTDPRVFVDYTAVDGSVVVASFTASPADPALILPSTEEVILRIDHPQAIHNGGGLAFGPDGDLYVSVGDGGLDPETDTQPSGGLLGRILRIDVDHRTASQPYQIPPDNPFADGAAASPETWLLGLRNPWRFSFDAATGDLWLGDVGANTWEEVDVARAGSSGLDFGWPVLEGRHCYGDAVACPETGTTAPVVEYQHGPDCAVVGGVVYRGTGVPALDGDYVFGDYCSGRIYAIPAAADAGGADGAEGAAGAGGEALQPAVIGQAAGGVAAFGLDQDGELYVANVNDGAVSRVVAAP